MLKHVIILLSVIVFGSEGSQQVSSIVRREIAPTGKLRMGINFGNALLATKDASGMPAGITVDLAREISRRVGLSMEIVSYESAGHIADAAKTGVWDVAFLGVDPARGNEIVFSTPYLEIESTYLVPAGSALRTVADVDRDNIRIAISDKSAYDLFLSRTLKRARLIRAPGVNPSVDLFFQQKLEALAGLKPLLVEVSQKNPGTRILDGRFTVVEQAIGTPLGRDATAKYLREFVDDIKSSGLLAKIIEKNGIRGVSIAPLRRDNDVYRSRVAC